MLGWDLSRKGANKCAVIQKMNVAVLTNSSVFWAPSGFCSFTGSAQRSGQNFAPLHTVPSSHHRYHTVASITTPLYLLIFFPSSFEPPPSSEPVGGWWQWVIYEQREGGSDGVWGGRAGTIPYVSGGRLCVCVCVCVCLWI